MSLNTLRLRSLLAMGAIAAWGIVESITFAGIMTMVEVGGLLFIAAVGFAYEPAAVERIADIVPPLTSPAIWVGIVSAGMLAVFAFIGFEGIVNLAEEMRQPRRDLPRAILLTLAITTVLYIAVMWVSLAALGPETLGATKAPLASVFEKLTGWPPTVMAAIAIVATLNGIIASIILAARICYGMAKRGDFPEVFARISPLTRTPLMGTALITAVVLVLALAVPLEGLADISSQMTLVMFGSVNLALVAIKWREPSPPAGIFATPMAVPVAGFIATLAFLAVDIAL
ncbi:MAG: APC family permease [Hyphomicrobiaceae bacterium]